MRNRPADYDHILVPGNNKQSLEDQHENFIIMANILKEKSGNKINLFKTGTFTKTALDLFDRTCKTVFPDPILQDEAIWLEKAKFKAMIFAVPCSGKMYNYDFVSLYPSIMRSPGSLFPIKKGHYKYISQAEFYDMKPLPFGIYKCVVEKSENVKINKQFVFNNKNYYTHLDLVLARELNLNIILFADTPNALLWDRKHLLTGQQLFAEFVDLLFDLKQQKIDGSKQILNCLWGSLCEMNKIPLKIKNNQNKNTEIDSDMTLLSLRPLDKNTTIVEVIKNDKYYETNFARICPFILSYGRLKISRAIRPHIDSIVRVHTDGFLSTKELNIETGTNLGEIKLDIYQNCKVYNNIRIDKNHG